MKTKFNWDEVLAFTVLLGFWIAFALIILWRAKAL